MLLSALEPLAPWKVSITPMFTPFTSYLRPSLPFYCSGALDWTKILKLKVLAFQIAIIHASLWSKTTITLGDVKHFPFYATLPPLRPFFTALGDLIGQLS